MATGNASAMAKKVQEGWNTLDRRRRLILIITVVSLLFIGVFLSLYLGRTQYTVLFSGLQAQEAGTVVDKLQERNVPYRVEDGGRTILVPDDQLYELRFELMGEGDQLVPEGGFALFDDNDLGMSSFERQVKYQRALQEELQRTIASLDSVSQARVHLVLPEPSVFIREAAEPSASVYLRLNNLSSLQEHQVRGIVNLVAGSVENLRPENITVVDSSGTILYDFLDDEQSLAVSGKLQDQLEVRREFEAELEKQLARMLKRVFGAGKAIATVNAELDFDTTERTVISYSNEPVQRSQQIVEESHEGEGSSEIEVGESNYPGYQTPLAGGESSYERREEITNYEVGETVEHQIIAPGTVRRLSTAVVIDDNSLTEEQVQQVNELVASTIGYDPERGDAISVEGMNFDTTRAEEVEAVMAEAAEAERQRQLYNNILLGAALLAGVLLLVLFWRSPRRKKWTEHHPAGAVSRKTASQPSLDQIMDEPEPSPQNEKREKIKRIAEKEPETVVHLLRTWLSED